MKLVKWVNVANCYLKLMKLHQNTIDFHVHQGHKMLKNRRRGHQTEVNLLGNSLIKGNKIWGKVNDKSL
jgi:hypothetical protein